MIKVVVIAALLAACSDDADPRELVACEGRPEWGEAQCERACLGPAAPQGKVLCVVEDANGSRIGCGNPWAVDSDDASGCCFPDDAAAGRVMRFYPCE